MQPSAPAIFINDIERAYDIAGGRGKYQLLVAFASCISYMSTMTFIYSVPFFLIKPPVECFKNGQWTLCDTSTVCKDPSITYRYTREHDYNFVTQFDLLCKDQESAFIVSAYFLGSLASCLFVNALSDMLGRLPMLIVGNVSNCLFIGLIVAFPSYSMTVLASALIGLTVIANTVNSFTYLYDSFPKKYAAFYGTLVNLSWGIGQLIIPPIMLTQIKWKTMCFILIAISGSFLILLVWLRESPKFFFAKSLYAPALSQLKHIAKVNGSPLPENLMFYEEHSYPATDKATARMVVTSTCCSATMLNRIFLFTFGYSVSSLVFSAISLNVENVGGNVYLNGIMMALSVMASSITAGALWNVLGKKGSLLLYFSVAALGVFLQGAFQTNLVVNQIGMYTATFGSSAACGALFLMSADLYPNNIKAIALGISIFFGRLTSVFSKPMALMDPFVMCMFLALLSAAAAILSLFFPKEGAERKTSMEATVDQYGESKEKFGKPEISIKTRANTTEGNKY